MTTRPFLAQTALPTALWLVLYVIRGVTGILARHVRSMRLAGRSVRTQEQRVMAVRLLERVRAEVARLRDYIRRAAEDLHRAADGSQRDGDRCCCAGCELIRGMDAA